MLVGVDCGNLVEEGRTGTHNYLYNLLKKLAVLDQENDYLLYFRKTPSDSFWSDLSGENSKWRYRILQSDISWTQAALSHATFADKPDVLLCTWHTLPVFHNKSTRIISVIHDFSYNKLLSYPIYASLLLADKIVGVSDSTYSQILKKIPWRKNKVVRIYEGIDVEKYQKADLEEIGRVRRQYGLDKNFFLSVGTLNKRKNLENMMSAFSKLMEKQPELDMYYAVVGKCKVGYQRIYDFANSLFAGKRIKFLGRLEDREVISLYSGSSALLYVSLEEGFGLPILEAFACSCPVITSNLSSTKEIGGSGAWLIDPHSVDDIVEAMLNVLIQKDVVEDKVDVGLKRVKLFTWDVCATQMMEIYQ